MKHCFSVYISWNHENNFSCFSANFMSIIFPRKSGQLSKKVRMVSLTISNSLRQSPWWCVGTLSHGSDIAWRFWLLLLVSLMMRTFSAGEPCHQCATMIQTADCLPACQVLRTLASIKFFWECWAVTAVCYASICSEDVNSFGIISIFPLILKNIGLIWAGLER